MKWIGQHIYDLISRFRDDVYLEDLTTTTETNVLVVDSDGKVSKSTSVGGDLTEITAGTLIDVTNGTGPNVTVDVDLREATEAAIEDGDYILFLDGGAAGTAAKESLSDLVDLLAGNSTNTGLSSADSILSVTDLHTVGVDGIDNNLLTDTGSGTINSEANLTFNSTSAMLAQRGGDYTLYDNDDDGNPSINLGSSATDDFQIQTVYNSGVNTLDYVNFVSTSASTTTNDGRFYFNVDGNDVMTLLDTAVFMKGKVQITQDSAGDATPAPALTVANEDIDQIALSIDADNVAANVLDISALAATSANIIDIDADALTTGSAINIDVDDAITGTTNSRSLVVIDYDKNGDTASGTVNSTTGVYVQLTDNADDNVGDISMVGNVVAIDSTDADGGVTQIGYKAILTDGDVGTTIGYYSSVEDGGVDFKAFSSANAADMFSLATTANGATSLTTVDGDGSNHLAHLDLTADGKITMTPADISGDVFHLNADADTDNVTNIDVGVLDIDATATATITTAGLTKFLATGGVEIEHTGATSALLIDNNISNQIALDIDAINTSANVVDIACAAIQNGNIIDVAATTFTTGSLLKFAGTTTPLTTTNSTLVDLVVDFEAVGTSDFKGIHLDVDKDGITANTKTSNVYGMHVDLDDSVTNVGTVNSYGVAINNNFADTGGTVTAYGIYTNVGGADTNYDIYMENSADSTEAAHMAVGAGGALTITTVSDDATGNLNLTADGGVSIDGTDDSNLTVTGSGKDLDIAVAGGGAQELRLASAGTGSSAVSIQANAGAMAIAAATGIELDCGDEIELKTGSADGHILLESMHTAGVAVKIDGNQAADSEVVIDAGILDMNVTGATTLDTTGTTITSTVNTDVSSHNFLTLDANTSGDGEQIATALYIDFDRSIPGSGTESHEDIGINLDVTSLTLGTSEARGMDIDVVGRASAVASTVYGIDCVVSGADTHIGMLINTPADEGSHHLKLVSAEDTADYCAISTRTSGATTISTVDGGGAAAHLDFDVDGDVRGVPMHYQFIGYSTGDGTNYEYATAMSDNKAPFEHDETSSADGTSLGGVGNISVLIRMGGHVMPRASILKKWTGSATYNGANNAYVSLFRWRPVDGSSTDVVPVLLHAATITGTASGGNDVTQNFAETPSASVNAGDVIFTQIKTENSGKSVYFNSTLEVELGA